MEGTKKQMQKRAYERISSNVPVHFNYGDSINFGIVTNFSENGMFVSTKMVLAPVNSKFEITIHSQHTELNVPIQVKRIVMEDNFYKGFGVELLNLPEDYSTYVKGLKK